VKLFGNGRVIAVNAGARNAWEIKVCRPTTSYRTPKLIRKFTETKLYKVLKTLFCSANTAIETARGNGESFEPIEVDGDLPIP